MMTYILTPYMQDFKLICEENNLPYRNGQSSPHVVWVDRVQKLFGRKINESDRIIKGHQYDEFATETRERIEMEIAIRKR